MLSNLNSTTTISSSNFHEGITVIKVKLSFPKECSCNCKVVISYHIAFFNLYFCSFVIATVNEKFSHETFKKKKKRKCKFICPLLN